MQNKTIDTKHIRIKFNQQGLAECAEEGYTRNPIDNIGMLVYYIQYLVNISRYNINVLNK